MKLLELENEEMLDALVEVIEPAEKVFQNENVVNSIKSGASKLATTKVILKNCKPEMLDFLAAMDCTPRAEYKCTLPALLKGTLEILSNSDIIDFFMSLAAIKTAFSAATENTEENEN